MRGDGVQSPVMSESAILENVVVVPPIELSSTAAGFSGLYMTVLGWTGPGVEVIWNAFIQPPLAKSQYTETGCPVEGRVMAKVPLDCHGYWFRTSLQDANVCCRRRRLPKLCGTRGDGSAGGGASCCGDAGGRAQGLQVARAQPRSTPWRALALVEPLLALALFRPQQATVPTVMLPALKPKPMAESMVLQSLVLPYAPIRCRFPPDMLRSIG